MLIGARTATMFGESIDPLNCDVEYLETRSNVGDKNSDAYFITNFIPNRNSGIKIDWMLFSDGYVGIYNNGSRFGIGTSRGKMAWETDRWRYSEDYFINYGERFTAELNNPSTFVKFGSYYESNSAGRTYGTTLNPMLLFDCYFSQNLEIVDPNSHFNGRIYRTWLYDNGTLVHGYVGCLRDGVPCLRDFVTDEIIEKSGNGTLHYGNPIKKVNRFGE